MRKNGEKSNSLQVTASTALLSRKPTAKKNASTTTRIVALGINSSLIAIHMIGNSLVLTSLGPEDEAAAGLITTFQSFISGAAFGCLLNTGVALGNILGAHKAELTNLLAATPAITTSINSSENNFVVQARKNLDKELADTIRTSYVVGMGLSLVSTASCVALRFILPSVVTSEAGKEAGHFFLMFAIGGFAEFMGGNVGLIVTQVEKKIWLAMLSSATYRLSAVALGYLFGKRFNMGATGVGLGTATAGLLSFVGSQMLLTRSCYREMHLLNCHIDDFKKRLKTYLKSGGKLSLQRITEWGNIAMIAIVIGALRNSVLQALQPAIQINSFVGLVLQGMGQSSMMFFGEDCKEKEEHLNLYYKTLLLDHLKQYGLLARASQKVFLKNNLAGLILAGIMTGGIYLAHNPLMRLLIGTDVSAQVSDDAKSLLTYMMIGFFPDAVRIITGGLLRGWGDLLFPTIASLIIMTFIGVPASFGLLKLTQENFASFLWCRIAMIVFAAAFNVVRFFQHVKNDMRLCRDAIHFPIFFDALKNNVQTLDAISSTKISITTLVEKVLTLGLVLDEKDNDSAVNQDIFSVVANKLSGKYSIDNLKRDTARYIVEHLPEVTKRHGDIHDITRALNTSAIPCQLILEALSNILKRDIVLVTEENNPYLIRYKWTNESTLYLAYASDQNRYYSLSGELTKELRLQIEKNSVKSESKIISSEKFRGTTFAASRSVALNINGDNPYAFQK